MDIPNDIGKHCTLASCNELDYLPIKCDRCANVYCKNHVFPDYHQCQSLPPGPLSSSVPAESFQRCVLENCNNLSLEAFISDRSETASRLPALCSKCQRSFCISHRHPSSHACSPDEPESQAPAKNEAARALLAKHFPASSTSATPTPATASKPRTSDPKKLAQIRKVELMKMRHRAVPVDPEDKAASVAVDQRVYIKATFEGDPSTVKVVWCRKTLIAGKALDYLASQLNVCPPLQICRADSEDRSPLRLDQPLSQQVEDGSSVTIIAS